MQFILFTVSSLTVHQTPTIPEVCLQGSGKNCSRFSSLSETSTTGGNDKAPEHQLFSDLLSKSL